MKTPPRRESAIQTAVLACLRAHGILCWPQNREKANWRRASHVGFRGLPDIGGILRGGQAIQVEVKRPGEDLSRYQVGAHAMLRKQGAAVFTVSSVEDVRRALELLPAPAVVPSPTFGGQPISWATQRRLSADGP